MNEISAMELNGKAKKYLLHIRRDYDFTIYSPPALKLWTILESESCDDVFWKSLRYEKGAEVVVIQFIALVATFGKVQPW